MFPTEDSEGGGVDERGPGPEHESIGEVEDGDVGVEDCGERQPQRGQQRSAHRRHPETNL